MTPFFTLLAYLTLNDPLFLLFSSPEWPPFFIISFYPIAPLFLQSHDYPMAHLFFTVAFVYLSMIDRNFSFR